MPLAQKRVLRGKWTLFGMLYGNHIDIVSAIESKNLLTKQWSNVIIMEAKITEYTEAINTYKFYHDYRMRILNYMLTLNAALFIIVGEHVSKATVRMAIGSFSIFATLTLMALEVRTIRFANVVWDNIENLEKEHECQVMTNLRKYTKSKGVP
jgi:hypothetical protein